MQNQCVNSPLYTQNSILSFRRESALVCKKRQPHTQKLGRGDAVHTKQQDTQTQTQEKNGPPSSLVQISTEGDGE